jgi:hypothetical protein
VFLESFWEGSLLLSLDMQGKGEGRFQGKGKKGRGPSVPPRNFAPGGPRGALAAGTRDPVAALPPLVVALPTWPRVKFGFEHCLRFAATI